MSAIEEIKQKLDIVEIAGQYTQLVKSGKNFKGVCPFHQEKHGSFFVFPDRQGWHCFGACSTGGDIFSLVMKKEGLDFKEALKLLAARAGVTLPAPTRLKEEKQKYARLYETNDAARDYYYEQLKSSPEAEKARAYVIKRKINAESLATFKLGYSSSGREKLKNHLIERGFTIQEMLGAGLVIETESGTIDRFRNRLMFPIANREGKTAGFGGREMDGSQPKYLNSPETPIFDKSGLLYGLNLALEDARKKDALIIVEGYMDAIISYQHGFKNTVAAMGTSVGDRQIEGIKKITRNLFLAMDADEAGEKAMLRLIDYENTLNNEIKVVIIPPGLDPDDVINRSPADWQQMLDSAEPLLDFSFAIETGKVELNSAAGKSRLAETLLPTIAQIQNPVRQAHYLQKLAGVIKVDEQRLESSLKSLVTRKSGTGYRAPVAKKPSGNKIFSSPREEFCLSMLIQYPQLIAKTDKLKREYFTGSENAELFALLSDSSDPQSIEDLLDAATREHYEQLKAKTIDSSGLETKLKECILLLKESHLRRLLQNQEAILSSTDLTEEEREVFAKQGCDVNQELKELFYEKSRSLDRMKGENNTDGNQ
ncbi:MAG: DNA primase [Dehalococcoidales bacterium]|nr:DNA primase [Dehalococcoidales bacterium]